MTETAQDRKPQRDVRRAKKIVILSDTHAGSEFAPYPERLLPADASLHLGTRYMNECFEHAKEEIGKCDLVILNGDLIDGRQKKSGGLGLYTPHLRGQVEAAIELLAPITAKAKRVMRVLGTPYHDDEHDPLGLLDSELGIDSDDVDDVFDLELRGSGILNVTHHPSFKFEHKGGGMSKTAFYNLVNAARRKAPRARWIVESHLHFYAQFEDADVRVTACPCWQLPTPWARKINRRRFVSDIGCIVMEHDPTQASEWVTRPILYDTPKSRVRVA